VAGVSHELRTPLAVITSAAENIADGIIGDTLKLRRYGTVIRNQSHQLTDLVEKILMFAATRQERYKLALQPVPPAELVQRALASSAELIRGAGFTVEREVEPDLPAVQVDVAAVTHCLQNLIANAVKYGGQDRWIGVCARQAETGKNGREVQISVQDRGMGIEASDLPRIFDPFFRGAHVIAAQIHGTGLGLSLAKRIAEAMGGSLSVTSKPGQGSTFVLHLPCAEESKGPQKTLEEETHGAAQP
jgi:signal transduction histidine kinase